MNVFKVKFPLGRCYLKFPCILLLKILHVLSVFLIIDPFYLEMFSFVGRFSEKFLCLTIFYICREQSIVGSPFNMAPELLRGECYDDKVGEGQVIGKLLIKF